MRGVSRVDWFGGSVVSARGQRFYSAIMLCAADPDDVVIQETAGVFPRDVVQGWARDVLVGASPACRVFVIEYALDRAGEMVPTGGTGEMCAGESRVRWFRG